MRLACPIPISDYPRVLLAHGGGGKLMRDMISKLFAAAFADLGLQVESDAAILAVPTDKVAFTTDTFVVRPTFFPGGDVGTLAVNGTVNDLATAGATDISLSMGFILEEGLAMEDLWRVAQSVAQAAREAGVKVVTGDTKVVERGHGDGVFINSAGIGIINHGLDLSPSQIRPGDALVVNGDLARHGMAVVSQRESLGFEPPIESDCAPLNGLVQAWLQADIGLKCLRDITRGGLTSVLYELASASHCAFYLDESAIPLSEEVRGACELLGLDPLHIACEGRMLAVVSASEAHRAVEVGRSTRHGAGTVVVGHVREPGGLPVTMKSRSGADRAVSQLTGEPLPRIC